MQGLKGQTALVTGASRGIGRAVALQLAKAGAELLLHYHKNQAAAQSVLKEIGGSARLLQADLQSPKEIDSLVRSLGNTKLDILINNAACGDKLRWDPPRLKPWRPCST